MVNVTALKSAAIPDKRVRWDEDRVILYHLGLGAGADYTSREELRYTYEADLKVLPTFGVILASDDKSGDFLLHPDIDLPLASIVHGEQDIVLQAPLPTSGAAVTKLRVSDVYDRGSGTLVVIEGMTYSQDDGRLLFENRMSLFSVGTGGFGGERGPKTDIVVPTRPADAQVDLHVLPQQAQIYRLSGDKTKLHVDPDYVRSIGFEKPFMHGLCTYGMTCKAIVDHLLDGDVAAIRRFRARFAKPVYPGETISVSAWREDGRIVAEVANKDTGAKVLSNCAIDLRS